MSPCAPSPITVLTVQVQQPQPAKGVEPGIRAFRDKGLGKHNSKLPCQQLLAEDEGTLEWDDASDGQEMNCSSEAVVFPLLKKFPMDKGKTP